MKCIKQIKIPYSIGSFEQLREDDYYYVDKTEFIRELEVFKVPVYLRPRRFGKTLWCSTLESYYDISRKNKFELLFGNLAIGKDPTEEKNSYMVLRLNFSKVAVKQDLCSIEESFSAVCRDDLKTFISKYRYYFQDTISIDDEQPISTIINTILSVIEQRNLPPMMVIIDEYDNFTNQLITMNRDEMYEQVTSGDSFFRSFFKVLKSGIEMQSIGRMFITGVLPITMDDLTSGFNIAEIVTLKKQLHNMLGFTQSEVVQYFDVMLKEYSLNDVNLQELLQLVKRFYNGYRFLPSNSETLYNSTILTYFIKNFVIDGGEIPTEMIDPNIKTDVNWIRRLAGGKGEPLEMLRVLINGEGLEYDESMLSDKFNMNQFFDKDFYPISLFYLGMITVVDEYQMDFPNQSLTKIFTDYYNTLTKVDVSKGYTKYFRAFLKDYDLIALFAGYYEKYIGQIPSQAFDKINENFIRTTFFELCTRYLSRHFTFAIETNYPSGRCDWEMLGRFDTVYRNNNFMIEFKYYKKSQKREFDSINGALLNDIEQVKGYAQDAKRSFPNYNIRTFICYVNANNGFKMYEV